MTIPKRGRKCRTVRLFRSLMAWYASATFCDHLSRDLDEIISSGRSDLSLRRRVEADTSPGIEVPDFTGDHERLAALYPMRRKFPYHPRRTPHATGPAPCHSSGRISGVFRRV